MNQFNLKSILLATGIVVINAMPTQAQNTSQSGNAVSITLKNGKVVNDVKQKNIPIANIQNTLASLLGLNSANTFAVEKSTTDKLGVQHITLQQYYNGVKVDGAKVLTHSKNGVLQSINGKAAPIAQMVTTAAFVKDEAMRYAHNYLEAIKTIKEYPVNLEIVKSTINNNTTYTVAYKVRVDAKTLKGGIVMQNVFVDAQSGKVIKAVDLIAHDDVTATAHTYLNGVRSIVTDSTATHFRLYDNGRKIETLDAGGAETNDDPTSPIAFLNAREYTNNSTMWNEKSAIMGISLTNATNNIMTGIGFSTFQFPLGLVSGSSIGMESAYSWPDIKFDQTTLPLTSRNLFVFTHPDSLYNGVFAKVALMSGDITDTISFNINATANGIFNWNDVNGNAGTYAIENAKNPALDAHWGISRSYDFYVEKFNRQSYDGNGSKITNYMNGVWPSAASQDNAAALPDPYFSMVYGMGNGITTNPFIALDVTGHEYTHMVVETNGNGGLEYLGESGALNESFADIFGTGIEHYAKPEEANWTMGEDVYIADNNFMRSLSQPKLKQNPHTYGKQYWVNPLDQNNDRGGVHTNSSIQNKWFHLLSEGGSGTNDNDHNYDVTPIGMDKALDIAYRNLTEYLDPQADYRDAYEGSLQAVIDLYGADTTGVEYVAVKKAWCAVGVGECVPSAIGDVAFDASDISIYPNPATTNLTIKSNVAEKLSIQVFNVLGANVMNIEAQIGVNVIDVSNLAKGVYTIKVMGNTGKVMVKKVSIL
jgi:Zn-dependent metalloprotease